MEVFLATTNGGKIERFKRLLAYVNTDITVKTVFDSNVPAIEVAETGATLTENARLKARAYLGIVPLPILSNDTGFYVEGEGFIDAPKRIALAGVAEDTLTKEAIAQRMLEFWKGIATKHGGQVDAAWVESFVVVYPDGTVTEAMSRREVVLTNQECGVPPLQMPVRALYYSKTTNKPALLHTEAEERLEMEPVITALKEVLMLGRV